MPAKEHELVDGEETRSLVKKDCNDDSDSDDDHHVSLSAEKYATQRCFTLFRLLYGIPIILLIVHFVQFGIRNVGKAERVMKWSDSSLPEKLVAGLCLLSFFIALAVAALRRSPVLREAVIEILQKPSGEDTVTQWSDKLKLMSFVVLLLTLVTCLISSAFQTGMVLNGFFHSFSDHLRCSVPISVPLICIAAVLLLLSQVLTIFNCKGEKKTPHDWCIIVLFITAATSLVGIARYTDQGSINGFGWSSELKGKAIPQSLYKSWWVAEDSGGMHKLFGIGTVACLCTVILIGGCRDKVFCWGFAGTSQQRYFRAVSLIALYAVIAIAGCIFVEANFPSVDVATNMLAISEWIALFSVFGYFIVMSSPKRLRHAIEEHFNDPKWDRRCERYLCCCAETVP